MGGRGARSGLHNTKGGSVAGQTMTAIRKQVGDTSSLSRHEIASKVREAKANNAAVQNINTRSGGRTAASFVTNPYRAPEDGQKETFSKTDAQSVVRRYLEDNADDILIRNADGSRIVTGSYKRIDDIMKKIPAKGKVEIESRPTTDMGNKRLKLIVRIK